MSNNTDNMEMPCLCACGEWFDLHDGYRTLKYSSSVVVCHACHEVEKTKEREIIRLQEEVDELEYADKKPKTREKLYKKIEELKDELYY